LFLAAQLATDLAALVLSGIEIVAIRPGHSPR